MSETIANIEERFGQLGEERFYHIEGNQLCRTKSRKLAAGSIFAWIQNLLRFILLPQGYPSSVSDDYMQYQLWDTLQAFCSYLSGTLTTRAIMQGVGVGDAAATPLAATITWIMRDGTGMVGRIVFASWKGPELDTNCKKWRLAADILNDMAMSLELCSPLFPESYFALVLCLATSMKAIVGVAGGATRAALTQHQARNGNMADVAAKDGSQETFVNLIASNIGIIILPLITSNELAWMLFSLLTSVHLFANYRAVCCLNIPILNAPRFNILFQQMKSSQIVLSPKEVNAREPVVLGRNDFSNINGWSIKLGESFSTLKDVSVNQIHHSTSLNLDYAIFASPSKMQILVMMRKGKQPDVLKAYFNALLVGCELKEQSLLNDKSINRCLSVANEKLNNEYQILKEKAQKLGWLMEKHQLLVNEWVADWSAKKIN
ncbi:RUS family member 1 isoform X1 [Neocloeon triangulifer]|uniref:RUS family member 1 isoform X1 n=1 Tax=Neocloeon triangulifer TaxID=2078957 RepID=UPI00286ECD51|nr:RUS family member 1 isoform X1 [Neocloeon triangulifer]